MSICETWFAVDRDDRVVSVWTSAPGAWPINAVCLESTTGELAAALAAIQDEDGPASCFRHDPSDGSTRYWRHGGGGQLLAAHLPAIARDAVRRVVLDIDASTTVAFDLKDQFDEFETIGEAPLVAPKQPLETSLEYRRLQFDAWRLLDAAMSGHPEEENWANKTGGFRASHQWREMTDERLRSQVLAIRAPLTKSIHFACLAIVERQLLEMGIDHANAHDFAWQTAAYLVSSWDPDRHPLAEQVPFLGPMTCRGILLRARREGRL